MDAQRFRATVIGTERGGEGHLVEVPIDVIAALGGKGPIPLELPAGKR